MKDFISDFKSRVIEIGEYYNFVEYIDKIETYKKEKLISSVGLEFIPKRELQKILRSKCFLLLYNLIESSVRNSILSVYDCVHDESLKFEQISDKLQKIWLNYQSKQLPNSDKNVQKWIKSLVEDISNGSEIKLTKETINISGNLDYKNIMKIIDTYGFYGKLSNSKLVENSIDKVKVERNLLAHGNKTFCQSGEIITFSDLISIKDNVICFLNEYLTNVETYIDGKKYKK